MPFGSGYGTRRANRRKRRPRRRVVPKVDTMQAVTHLAKKAWSGFNYVRGLLNVEKKFIDFSVSGTAAAAGAVTLLTGLAAGDTNTTRDGNQIRYKYMNVKYQINTNTISTVNRLLRIVIFMDSQNQSALPAVTDVLEAALNIEV